MTRDMSDKNQRSPHHESTGRPRHPSGLALGLRAMLLAGLLITALPQVAAASNSIVFGDATTSTSPSGAKLIEVDMGLDLSEITVGGGIGVEYDETRLEYVSFRFDPMGPTSFTSAPVDESQTQPLAIGGGWVTLTPPFGVSGVQPFGTLTFRVISDGNATISAVDGIAPLGPFAGTTGTPLVMTDASMIINVDPPNPAPPAVPALGSQWMVVLLSVVMILFGALSLGPPHARANI
jgi:hypothetical protein